MTSFAFLLIFFSIFLHAGWHVFSKSQKPQIAFYLIVSFSSIILNSIWMLIGGIQYGLIPYTCFLYAACAGLCGAVTNAGLSLAYRNQDVTLAYPMARALPVLFTVIVTVQFGIGSRIHAVSLLGMLIVIIGCFFMPMKSFSDIAIKNYWNKGLLGIILASLGTTGYTIFDGLGMNLIRQYSTAANDFFTACSYSLIREIVIFQFLSVIVLVIPEENKHFSWKLFIHGPAYIVGIGAAGAYWLVLLAMVHVTNFSFVQVFRQMSLPVGLLMGIIFLHEKCHLPKLLGVSLIVLGLIITYIYK